MKKQLGIKTSPLLCICRIVAIMLFIGTVGGFFLSAIDLRTTDILSDEYRAELMSEESFRIGTKTVLKFVENPTKYGDIDDIISIEYSLVSYSSSLGGKPTPKELVYINMKGKQDKYFNITNNFALMTEEEYEETKSSSFGEKFKFYSETDSYKGVELKLIKEIAESDTVSEIIYNWDKETISAKEEYPFIIKLLTLTVREYASTITEISCIVLSKSPATPATAAFKVETGDGNEPMCYWMQSGRVASMSYEEYRTLYSGDDVTYTGYELEIILSEAGVR